MRAPYSVNVFQIIAGPNMGKMIWSMGPCDFEHIGKNPGGDAHNEDWVTNIIPLTEDISHNGYWRLIGELSYAPEGVNFEKYRVRSISIKRGERYRFDKMMANIRQVYEKKRFNTPHLIFDRRMASSDGRDVDVLFGYNDWSELERPSFGDEYDEVHGEGSWQLFLEELEECVEKTNDELWQRVEAASADVNN